jgi:hypothetical protein
MGTSLAIMAAILVVLFPLAFVLEPETAAPAPQSPPPASVGVIAGRVEALRGLRFDEVPVARAVTPREVRREALEDLDRTYPDDRRRADEDVLRLLGLIGPDDDLRTLTASLFGAGVAGYYDPRTDRLRTVTGAQTGTPVLFEMVLAHELTHALEDQAYGVESDPEAADDEALARLALVEGSASVLMLAYADAHFTAEEALGGVLGSAFAPTAPLPPFLQSHVTFPYQAGAAFVSDLMRRAEGSWNHVDTAYELRPPTSTEPVLHPEAYFQADEPRPVRPGTAARLGEGWTRAATGTWGEFQTRELLRAGGACGATPAAEGWGGDRYELWRSGDDRVLVSAWRWDSAADADEFAAAVRPLATARSGVVTRGGGRVTLVVASDPALAERVARGR